MSLINQRNVIRLLKSICPESKQMGTSRMEANLARALLDLMNSATESATFEIIPDETLEFKESYELQNQDLEEPSTSTSTSTSTALDYRQRAVAYWLNYRPGWRHYRIVRSLQSVQEKFPQVQSIQQLKEWAEVLEGNTETDRFVYDRLAEETSVNAIVRDEDLQVWARDATGVVPSRNWLMDFKLENDVVTRKIHKFLSRDQASSISAEDLRLAQEYRERIHGYLGHLELQNLFNVADYQVNSKFSVTLIINGEGKLLPPLTLVVKDATKKAEQLASRIEATNPFLRVITGRFNTLTPKPFARWFQQVFQLQTLAPVPAPGSSGVLVINNELGSTLENLETPVKIEVIPSGLEFQLDPLARGFRIWLLYVKAINDYADLHHLQEFDRRALENLFKIYAFVHRQLMAERFQDVFKDSWRRAGFLDVENLESGAADPMEFAFGRNVREAGCQDCELEGFVRCAECGKVICFKHALMTDSEQGFHLH